MSRDVNSTPDSCDSAAAEVDRQRDRLKAEPDEGPTVGQCPENVGGEQDFPRGAAGTGTREARRNDFALPVK